MTSVPVATYPYLSSSSSSTSLSTGTSPNAVIISSPGSSRVAIMPTNATKAPRPTPRAARAPARASLMPTQKSWRDQPRSGRASPYQKKNPPKKPPVRHSTPREGDDPADHQIISMYAAAPKKHRTITDAYGESSHPLLTAAGQVLPATRSSLHLLHARFTTAYVLLVVTLAVMGLVFGKSPAITAPLLLVGLFPALLAGISFGALLTGNDIREHSQSMLFQILASPLRALLVLNGLAAATMGLYLANLMFAIRGHCMLYQGAHCMLDDTSGVTMCIVAGIGVILHVSAIAYYARIPGVLLNSR